jgi:hypothetical protein
LYLKKTPFGTRGSAAKKNRGNLEKSALNCIQELVVKLFYQTAIIKQLRFILKAVGEAGGQLS